MTYQNYNYTPAHVANYILEFGKVDRVRLTQMKLLKLTYISYAWYMLFTGKKLFQEDIQAWRYGPVIPSLYHEFKRFGNSYIDCLATSGYIQKQVTTPIVSDDDIDATKIISAVWAFYKDRTAEELSDMTHENIAWTNARKKGENANLSDDDIKECAKIGVGKYFALGEADGK